jgi:TM2 domain-containing membrane protein YozV
MSNKIFFLLVVILSPIYGQQIDIHSPKNIKKFADFLFCDKDYLRAIDEYKKYLEVVNNDTIRFKIALGYSLINDQSNALQEFSSINNSSALYEQSRIEVLKSLSLSKSDSAFYLLANNLINSKSQFSNNAQRLLNTSILLNENELPDKNKFLIPFENDDKLLLGNYYDLKINPPYKNETLAGILSAIIPGSGKIYTEDYGDGITAFLLTGLFTYLAYTNFENDHKTRGWIFTALGAGFYAGNVYGSVASAQIFNAKVNFDFENGLKLFLEDKNFFTPAYDFCK